MEDLRLDVKPNKLVRTQIIEFIAQRDGFHCFICKKNFAKGEDPTIDHWIPQSAGGTWKLENLRLAHSCCNSKKGSIIPNADGTITWPDRPPRSIRIKRPDQCNHCESGRILLVGEICELCGSGPQPATFPTAHKKKPKNCSHTGQDHCWHCVLGFVKRR